MNKQVTRSNRRKFLSTTTTLLGGSAALASEASSDRDANPALPAKAFQRSTLAEVDVLVVGGGPAGIVAALGPRCALPRHPAGENGRLVDGGAP